jgi:thymidylate kinase
MIILEGPDNSGKSTLATALVNQFGSSISLSDHTRAVGEERDRLMVGVPGRVYGALQHGVAGQGTVQLHDRLFFSELVYGRILRGQVCFNWTQQQHICRVLTAIQPPIIFCLPPIEKCLSNLHGRHQLEGVTENAELIYHAYDAMKALAKPPITVYDWTRGPAALHRIFRVVESYMERRNRRKW